MVRLGLVGAGVIGARHIGAMDAVDGVELVGIADTVPAAKAIADERGVPFFIDVEALLAETKPDGVVICTPTEHHLAPSLAALEAGAYVFVEKPICATVEEAQKIVAKSAEVGRHALVGHQRRYYPQVEKAREMVQGGALGPLVAVSGQWTVRKVAEYYDPDWRKRWQAGPVVTNLIHDMDSTRYICGDVESIVAETANTVFGWDKEDTAALVIRFKNGALGSFILSDQATSPWAWEMALGENIAVPKNGQNAMRFMGRDAALEFPNLVLWKHGGAPHDWTQPIAPEELAFTAEDAYTVQMRHFRDVIRGEAAPRIDAADATATLAATVAVHEAARSGRRVML